MLAAQPRLIAIKCIIYKLVEITAAVGVSFLRYADETSFLLIRRQGGIVVIENLETLRGAGDGENGIFGEATADLQLQGHVRQVV